MRITAGWKKDRGTMGIFNREPRNYIYVPDEINRKVHEISDEMTDENLRKKITPGEKELLKKLTTEKHKPLESPQLPNDISASNLDEKVGAAKQSHFDSVYQESKNKTEPTKASIIKAKIIGYTCAAMSVVGLGATAFFVAQVFLAGPLIGLAAFTYWNTFISFVAAGYMAYCYAGTFAEAIVRRVLPSYSLSPSKVKSRLNELHQKIIKEHPAELAVHEKNSEEYNKALEEYLSNNKKVQEEKTRILEKLLLAHIAKLKKIDNKYRLTELESSWAKQWDTECNNENSHLDSKVSLLYTQRVHAINLIKALRGELDTIEDRILKNDAKLVEHKKQRKKHRFLSHWKTKRFLVKQFKLAKKDKKVWLKQNTDIYDLEDVLRRQLREISAYQNHESLRALDLDTQQLEAKAVEENKKYFWAEHKRKSRSYRFFIKALKFSGALDSTFFGISTYLGVMTISLALALTGTAATVFFGLAIFASVCLTFTFYMYFTPKGIQNIHEAVESRFFLNLKNWQFVPIALALGTIIGTAAMLFFTTLNALPLIGISVVGWQWGIAIFSIFTSVLTTFASIALTTWKQGLKVQKSGKIDLFDFTLSEHFNAPKTKTGKVLKAFGYFAGYFAALMLAVPAYLGITTGFAFASPIVFSSVIIPFAIAVGITRIIGYKAFNVPDVVRNSIDFGDYIAQSKFAKSVGNFFASIYNALFHPYTSQLPKSEYSPQPGSSSLIAVLRSLHLIRKNSTTPPKSELPSNKGNSSSTSPLLRTPKGSISRDAHSESPSLRPRNPRAGSASSSRPDTPANSHS